jgi:hypothetical protein
LPLPKGVNCKFRARNAESRQSTEDNPVEKSFVQRPAFNGQMMTKGRQRVMLDPRLTENGNFVVELAEIVCDF